MLVDGGIVAFGDDVAGLPLTEPGIEKTDVADGLGGTEDRLSPSESSLRRFFSRS